MIDWHVFAGVWLAISIIAGFAGVFCTGLLVAEGAPRKLTYLVGALTIAFIVAVPFLLGYVATGGPSATDRVNGQQK